MNRTVKRVTGICLVMLLAICVSLIHIHPITVSATEDDIIIVLDPGHGGTDPGTISPHTSVREVDCNYAIAEAIRDELMTYKGVQVYFARSANDWTSNTGRAMAGAALKADFLLCLHNNSSTDQSVRGAVVYASVKPSYTASTTKMANYICDELVKAGIASAKVAYRSSKKWATEDYYTVVGESVRAGVPALLVEHCFLSNKEDSEFISEAGGKLKADAIKKIGVADANAIVKYFNLQKKSDDEMIPGNATPRKELALVCGINPTFYDEETPIPSKIDINKMVCFVIYDNGDVEKVTPESVQNVDTSKVGMMDLQVKYKNLTGYLRICNQTASYVPKDYLPLSSATGTDAPTDPPTQPPTNPATQPATDPATQPATDPTTTVQSTDPSESDTTSPIETDETDTSDGNAGSDKNDKTTEATLPGESETDPGEKTAATDMKKVWQLLIIAGSLLVVAVPIFIIARRRK